MNYHTVKTAMRQSDGRVTKYFTLCALISSCPFSSLLRVDDGDDEDDDDDEDGVQQRIPQRASNFSTSTTKSSSNSTKRTGEQKIGKWLL